MGDGGEERGGLFDAITRTFVALGVLAVISLLLALLVMTTIVDSPPIARWFLVSATLTGVCFLGAIAASRWR